MQAPSTPTSGDKLELAKLKGALLYITVKSVQRDIQTMHGLTDAVACDVAVLDGDHKGDEYVDTLIFPKLLVAQLLPAVGSDDPAVLARLGQGIAKPGKSAPWVLNTATADDYEVGKRYETYRAKRVAEQETPF